MIFCIVGIVGIVGIIILLLFLGGSPHSSGSYDNIEMDPLPILPGYTEDDIEEG